MYVIYSGPISNITVSISAISAIMANFDHYVNSAMYFVVISVVVFIVTS